MFDTEDASPKSVLHVRSKSVKSGAEAAAITIADGLSEFENLEISFKEVEPLPSPGDQLWEAIRYRVESKLLGWGFSETITPTKYSPPLAGQGIELLHLHNIYNSGLRIEDIRRLAKAFPLVWTIHDGRWVCWAENLRMGQGGALRQLGAAALHARLRNSLNNAEVVFPSAWLRQKALEHGLFSEKHTHVIPTPVAREFFDTKVSRETAKKICGLDGETPLILFVAWQAWKNKGDLNKGYGLLERAIPMLRKRHNFRFAILGHNGDQIPKHLEALWVSPDGRKKQVADWMAAADFIVGASKQEGLGNVIQEAHAVGTPALVSASTGYLEIVDDGRTGLHFRTEDEEDFVNKASQLLEAPIERHVMAVNASEKASRLWSPNVVAKLYREVYSRAVLNWG